MLTLRRTSRCAALAVAAWVQPVLAQSAAAPAAPPAPVPDRQQVEQAAQLTQAELARAEARASEATAQLVALDGEIETRIGRIVSLLSSVRDSADTSSIRMRKAKEDALEGLKATAVYYSQERDRRKREMANPRSPMDQEGLARDVAALNARIEVRVTQSLSIASSLISHREGTVDRYRDDDEDRDESDEYKKVKREEHASAKIKSDLVDDLRASIEKLSRDIKTAEEELRWTADAAKKERLTRSIAEMRETVEARRGQIEEAVAGRSPAARAVSQRGAFEMDEMLDDMVVELRSDFARFRSLLNERDRASARVKALQDRLARITTMLEKMPQTAAPTAPQP